MKNKEFFSKNSTCETFTTFPDPISPVTTQQSFNRNSLLEIDGSAGRLLRKDTIYQLSKDSKIRTAEDIKLPALFLYQPHDLGCVLHGFGTHRMSLDMRRTGLDTRRMGKFSNYGPCD